MSRKINRKSSITITEEESALRRTDAGKLLFTAYQGRNCALWFQDNRLVEASFFPENPSKIGAIYIGKVKNVKHSIEACFVEIAEGEICFLPFQSAKTPYLLNRTYDGRILEGDELLVQVVRDAQKTKQAAVTAQISISNDYFVMAMGSTRAAYSTKMNSTQKKTIRKLLSKKKITENNSLVQDYKAFLSPEQVQRMKAEGIALDTISLPPTGIVVRTKAGELESMEEGQSTDEKHSMEVERSMDGKHFIENEYFKENYKEELLGQFYAIAEQYIKILYLATHRSCFSCMKPAPEAFEDMVQRFCGRSKVAEMPENHSDSDPSAHESNRSAFHKNTANEECTESCGMASNDGYGLKEIVTDQEAMYEMLKDYCNKKEFEFPIRLYKDEMVSLTELYSVRRRMDEALGSKVWLKSGAYLVIEPTEALTVIDVNSGKNETGKNAGEAYLRINKEAAQEVAFQMRLRNLSGIILVDFINMESDKDEKELLDYLRKLTAVDCVLTSVVDITPLGLVEITRKKISRPLREQFLESEHMAEKNV